MPEVFAVVENVPGFLPDNEPVIFDDKPAAKDYAHWRADGIEEAEKEFGGLLDEDKPREVSVDKNDDGAEITVKQGDSVEAVIVIDIIEHDMSEDAVNQWREQVSQ